VEIETVKTLRRQAWRWLLADTPGWSITKAEAEKEFIDAIRAAEPIDIAHSLTGSDVIRFEITPEQYKQANDWFDSIMKRDKRHVFDYGAIGGGLSFTFTQTGLGTTVVATEALSKETLNLTDFSGW
jgi:hypothetical protein